MKALLLLICIGMLPAAAFGRAAIAGSVKDPSGRSIPDVTVEARSPALIEKTRVTSTDAAGRYRLENLPPGTYEVTFTHQGWQVYQQNDVVLTASFTATVDAQLSGGAITETIVVSGELPAVDARSATHGIALSGDVAQSLPTVRSYNALVALVPGVLTNTNDIVTGTATTSFPFHGGRSNEGRLSVNGLNVGSPPSGNSAASYVFDVGNAEEVTFTTPGPTGDVETSGVVMNIVPKSGGNTRHGSVFVSGTGERLQSNNLTQQLKDEGVTAATPLRKVYDVSGTFGGAIRHDRLWYFLNAHTGGSTKDSAAVFYNRNAGDPTKWLYAPDFSRREYSDRTFENASARVTSQLTPRNQLTGFWDEQTLCRSCTGATPGLSEPARVSPEAVGVLGRPLRVVQMTWSSPATDRWLLESSFGGTYFGVGNFERTPNPTRDLIRVVEQCANGCAANGNLPGLAYRSQDFSVAYSGSYLWKSSASYVTGTHSFKVGYQHTLMIDDRTWVTNTQNLTYRFNNGEPNQLTESISPWVNNARAAWDAVFAQDTWSRERVTVQGALRFDRAHSWFPAQQEGPSRFLPTPIVIPRTAGVNSYKDLTPRVGLAYDVFGTGRTAIKVVAGEYLDGVGVSGIYANTNPTLRLPQTTSVFGTAGVTRAWTDSNQNFVPDCDLLIPAAQDLQAAGGDVCGAVSNANFGRNILTNNFDPRILNGWGIRPSDWHFGLSLQQQIGRRSSIDVTYTHRWYRGFFVADNLALQPSDLTPFSVNAPLDARLPGGGGYVVSGLYNVVPDKAGQVNNLITDSRNYGRWRQYFNGLDATINLALGHEFTVMGGSSTGQTVADNCDVRMRLPELATTTTGSSAFGPGLSSSDVTPVSPYCHVAFGVLTQLRGLASYVIPKAAVQVAATVQSKPGAMLAANYAAPNSAVVSSLGRNLSGNSPNVVVNLLRPGTMYGDRINEIDLRVGKALHHGGARALIALDVYNALNSSAVLAYDSTFVPSGPWLQPTAIMTPRFFRITTEIEF